VSPKYSSLAFDELKEQEHEQHVDMHFEPELKVFVNANYVTSMNSFSSVPANREKVEQITGRITVSF
jgi:hypothetical protein